VLDLQTPRFLPRKISPPRRVLPTVHRSLQDTAARSARWTRQVAAGEWASGARPKVLRTAWFFIAVLRTFGAAQGS